MDVSSRARTHPLQVIAVGLALCMLAAAGGQLLRAQAAEEFAGRLSRMPVDRATAPSISGGGEVRATLAGNALTLAATFHGMSSAATAAHIHRAPVARRGPVALALDAPAAAAGRIEQTLTLTDAQVEALRGGEFYLQIHTENNPAGELRGWLLPAAGGSDDRER